MINRRELVRAGSAAAAFGLASQARAAAAPLIADVVVIGAGAVGLTAAIVAREAGASVIILETEADIGGHAACSGGNIPLGGGTSVQKKNGVQDSPDLLFRDLTDWSVTGPNGAADYRYNDREVIRAFADHSAQTFEFLLAHGVVFQDRAPDGRGGLGVGASVARTMHAVPVDWPRTETGRPVAPEDRLTLSTGTGLVRPLEAAVRKLGVPILLEHRMTSLVRQARDGRITGVIATAHGRILNVRARKAVILGTGGSTGNVEFRRMFDPRLTEEYQLAGMPWSNQDASGELAAVGVGASLWGLTNYSAENGWVVTKAGRIGCRYGYTNLVWQPGSRVWDRARASGLAVGSWQNAIMVNMLGRRFYDETGGQFSGNSPSAITGYVQDDWRNSGKVAYRPANFLNAAMAGIGDGKNGGGPIWAIFDADAVTREKWSPTAPNVDEAGYFYSAPTLAELARKIANPHQRVPMPPEGLEATVARYNGFVDAGLDADFAKPKPLYKIARGPFYAAWATPVIHDCRAGLRINGKGQVLDMTGKAIPGLYCGGESAGGFSQHGLARATCQGFIAGTNAAAEKA